MEISYLNDSEALSLKNLWNLAVLHRGRLTEIFYTKLFELDPPSRSLFKTDLVSQGWKLIDTLTFVIESVTNFEDFLQNVIELGRRHRDYKVKDYQYPIVFDTFLYAFNKILGDQISEDMILAWIKFYNYVSKIMINSVRG